MRLTRSNQAFNELNLDSFIRHGDHLGLAQNIFDGLATLRCDIARRRLLAQPIERCTNEVVRVCRTVAFSHDVLHTHYIKHCAHWTTGNHTSTIFRRSEKNHGCAVLTMHFVLKRTVFKRHLKHIATSLFHCFLNRNRNFFRFTLAHTNAAITVTHYGQGSKTENSATLNHFGHAINCDHLFTKAVVAFVSLNFRLHLCHDEFFP